MINSEERDRTSLNGDERGSVGRKPTSDMDSVPCKLNFQFSGLRSDVDDTDAEWQLLLRISAEFKITIDNSVYYQEVEFPVVEFANQLKKWSIGSGDFKYISIEAGDDPTIRFIQTDDANFAIEADGAEFECRGTIEAAFLRSAISDFCQRLKVAVNRQLGIDIGGLT